MKRWKRILFITSCILLFLWGCNELFWKNLQTVSEGYQNRFNYQAVLETKYAYNGGYQVELFTQEDSDERIKLLQVYYPVNMKAEQRTWPLVLMANGTGIRATKYKAIFRPLCSQSGTATLLVDSLGEGFLKDIKAPMLLMGGCGYVDAKALCKLDDLQRSYEDIGSQYRVMGRIKDTDHSDMLTRGDAYMTAWMRYWLCGDEKAGKCFVGKDAEILSNKGWQDVKRIGL